MKKLIELIGLHSTLICYVLKYLRHYDPTRTFHQTQLTENNLSYIVLIADFDSAQRWTHLSSTVPSLLFASTVDMWAVTFDLPWCCRHHLSSVRIFPTPPTSFQLILLLNPLNAHKPPCMSTENQSPSLTSSHPPTGWHLEKPHVSTHLWFMEWRSARKDMHNFHWAKPIFLNIAYLHSSNVHTCTINMNFNSIFMNETPGVYNRGNAWPSKCSL